MGLGAMIFVFWMLSFKLTFSLSSFTFIKRLFSSSLSAIRVVSSAYLRLLIFLPAVLIPVCDSSSPAFSMIYSAVMCTRSCFSHVWVFVTLWTVAPQAPLSMGLSKQEYRNGLPCCPPGDLSNPGIKSVSLTSHTLAGRFFTTNATWESLDSACRLNKQGNNIQYCRTPFPVLNQSVVSCLVLTVACWRIMDGSS